MSVPLMELVQHIEQLLQPQRFKDYCPNGLQVEGRPRVQRLVSGVTACQALLDAAVAEQADAILVHHGYFWQGDSPCVVGMQRRRLGTLLTHDISLLAYHLPLDAHPELGNNAALGRRLGIAFESPLHPGLDAGVGSVGSLERPMPAAELLQRIASLTGRQPLYIGDPQALVQRIAWCTGAAQGYIDAAVAVAADLYLTGEASEQTVHSAREQGIGFIAAGHHATERYGVQALGQSLATTLGIDHQFIDIDNPV